MSDLPLGFVKNVNLGDVRLKYVSHTQIRSFGTICTVCLTYTGEFLEASTNHDARSEE